MTRSVTIVNTSSWESENVLVTATSKYAASEQKMLEPGDKMTVGPHAEGELVAVAIQAALPADAKPFHDAEGNQDWPRLEVHKPKGSGD